MKDNLLGLTGIILFPILFPLLFLYNTYHTIAYYAVKRPLARRKISKALAKKGVSIDWDKY